MAVAFLRLADPESPPLRACDRKKPAEGLFHNLGLPVAQAFSLCRFFGDAKSITGTAR